MNFQAILNQPWVTQIALWAVLGLGVGVAAKLLIPAVRGWDGFALLSWVSPDPPLEIFLHPESSIGRLTTLLVGRELPSELREPQSLSL